MDGINQFMVTTNSLLMQFSFLMKQKGIGILFSIRSVIGWLGIVGSLITWEKPSFLAAVLFAVYFLGTSILGKSVYQKKRKDSIQNSTIILFLVADYLILLLGFYYAILSYDKTLVALPIQNSIFFSLFLLYQLYIGFYLHRSFSAIMGGVIILGYVGGITLSVLCGAEFYVGFQLLPQLPNRIVLILELLKIFLLFAKTLCVIKLVSFLLEILETNQHILVEQLNRREASLIQNDRLVTLGSLVSNVAHEINNPLAGIKSMNEFLFQEEGNHLTRIDPLWQEKEKQVLWKHRNRFEKKEDWDWIQNSFQNLPTSDRQYLADRCIDLGIDERSFEGLKDQNHSEWIFVFLWLKYKTMEKANLLIANAIDRTEKVILTFRQFATPYLEEDKNNVKVGQGLRNILLLYNQFWDGQRTLVTEIDDSLTAYICEPAMKLVWSHLIYNAIQATEVCVGEIKIKVFQNENHQIELQVIDNGKGISEREKSEIFKPFFSTKESSQGIGLGLYVSKEIVEKQNGTIDFISKPGRTEFRVLLPKV